MGEEQVSLLRLPPRTAASIRELAATDGLSDEEDGLSDEEMVEIAVAVYAAVPSERRAALKAALRDGSQADFDESATDRASVVRFFDAVRSRLAAEMKAEATRGSETDEDLLAEAVRLTKRR